MATVATVGLAASAPAQTSTSVVPISLAAGSFTGLPPAEQGGFQHSDTGLAEVGDVNGDGRPDVLVSSGVVQRAGVFVVLGQPGAAPVDLRRLGGRGFGLRGGGRLEPGRPR